MTKTPEWLPDGSGIDPESFNGGDTVVETVNGFFRARHAVGPIVRVFADVTPPQPDPRRNVLVAELLAALPGSALSRSGADNLADTLLAALDAMGADR